MTPMPVSSARVATEQPSLYVTRFCEHVAQQRERHGAPDVEVAYDEQEGFVDFAPIIAATCRLDARRDGVLVIEATAADEAALAHVQRLVGEHLQRFGRDEGLTVEWSSP